MKKTIFLSLALVAAFTLGSFVQSKLDDKEKAKKEEKTLKLGVFSLSMNVKDLKVSKAFYENLGFRQSGGDENQNYVVMKNERTVIGLFQGIFEGNMLTFNPGWDENKKNLKKFDDVRVIQKELKAKDVTLIQEADDKTTGPAYIMFNDPDGNVILIDQHR
jgi:catechol 2,3-dioxygenase-like lactoylglutathione lyase family enzyme